MLNLISSSDQTISKVVNVNLSGNSFLSWKRKANHDLIAKNKLDFLDGEIGKPDDLDKDYNRWMRCDYLVTCWLMDSMDPDIAENFTYIDNSAQLWLELGEQYGQSNGAQVCQPKKELCLLFYILASWRDFGMNWSIYEAFQYVLVEFYPNVHAIS